MNALPNHLVKSLKEDPRRVDYSRWERRSRSRNAPQDQTEPPSWVVLPPAPPTSSPRRDDAAAAAPPGREDGRTTSPNTHTHTHTPHKTPQTTDKPGRSNQKSRPATGYEDAAAAMSQARLSRRRRNESVELDPASIRKKKNIKTLKLLIRTRRRAIEELEGHHSSLQLGNERIASQIRDVDSQSVASARDFLIRHEKLGSSIAAFNGWSHSQVSHAHRELREAEHHAQTRLQALQEQLCAVRSELVRSQAELHTLKTYKDKEFPVKALRIAHMKRDVLQLHDTQQEELEDVGLLCQTERLSLHRHSQRGEGAMLQGVAQEHVSNVPPVVKLMASHNAIMRREIELHKQEVSQLESSTSGLLQSIEELQRTTSSSRRTLFPHVFPSADRCLPDMDVALNIPREEWLPI